MSFRPTVRDVIRKLEALDPDLPVAVSDRWDSGGGYQAVFTVEMLTVAPEVRDSQPGREWAHHRADRDPSLPRERVVNIS